MQKKNRYDWNVYRKEISIRSQRRMNQVIEYVEFTSFLLQIHFKFFFEKRSAVSQILITSLSYGTEHILSLPPHRNIMWPWSEHLTGQVMKGTWVILHES